MLTMKTYQSKKEQSIYHKTLETSNVFLTYLNKKYIIIHGDFFMSRFYYSDIFECQESYDILKQELKNKSKMVFIPASFDETKNENLKNQILEFFLNIGIIITDGKILSPYENGINFRKEIMETDIVFFLDGNPSIQLDMIERLGIRDAITKTNATIIGTNNGSKTMSKNIWLLPNEFFTTDMTIKRGLALTKISVYPKYNTEGMLMDEYDTGERVISKKDILTGVSKTSEVFLLNDTNCIIDNEGNFNFIGNDLIKVMNEGIIRYKSVEKTYK